LSHQKLPNRSYAALLFDMDGTILNSIAVANRVWTTWAERHGIDPAEVRAVMHGVQAAETVRRFAKPGMDPDHEAALITAAEIEDVEGVVEIAGARHLLDQLADARWAVVTSAPSALALRRMEAAGLPLPPVMISAEDIANGKPAPDCFLAAASALGVAIEDCLIWEDAPAGIAAAEAAEAAAIIVVRAAHDDPPSTSHSVARDYRGLAVAVQADGSIRLTGVTP
jgi:sugar-phosphatase